MRKINFKAPKTAGAEGHRTLIVALWLWNHEGRDVLFNNNNNGEGTGMMELCCLINLGCCAASDYTRVKDYWI